MSLLSIQGQGSERGQGEPSGLWQHLRASRWYRKAAHHQQTLTHICSNEEQPLLQRSLQVLPQPENDDVTPQHLCAQVWDLLPTCPRGSLMCCRCSENSETANASETGLSVAKIHFLVRTFLRSG